jgi:GDP/UDP-N,N'-diacetylbacillosamine 2-epimerase (hydrolysing)
MQKKIIALSVGRSDYDRYYPILKVLDNSKKINLYLYLTISHQDFKFGKTENFVDPKFKIIKRKYLKKDSNKNISYNFINDLGFFIKKIDKIKPDLIMVLGDRYEMLIGPIAAIPKNIPVLHLYGGAVTEGSTDELVRHAITKMSHYHLVVLKDYKKRILQLGEEGWRTKVIGLHELNNKKKMLVFSKKYLSRKFKFDFSKSYCLATYHPVTLELKKIKQQLKNLISVFKSLDENIVITYPNADPQHDKIIKEFKHAFIDKKKYLFVKNFGMQSYVSVLSHCEFMIGNSSSGIVESGSFKKPAINIGTRQDGKHKPVNVIESGYSKIQILNSIKKAKNKYFQKKIKKIKNPYESKIDLKKILNDIINLKLNNKLLRKKFINY